MTIETLLTKGGLIFIRSHNYHKMCFVKDSHYGVYDELLAIEPGNGTMLFIGRNHIWTVHMWNLSEEKKKTILARMVPSAQHEVVTQMETLARDYGCSYKFDGKKEVISKATYEEDKAKLEEDIEQSNGKIGKLKSQMGRARSESWTWMVFGIAAAFLGAALIASMNATAIVFGIIAMVAGICGMVVWGVKLSRANAEDARCDAALAAETQKRDGLAKKRDELLERTISVPFWVNGKGEFARYPINMKTGEWVGYPDSDLKDWRK